MWLGIAEEEIIKERLCRENRYFPHPYHHNDLKFLGIEIHLLLLKSVFIIQKPRDNKYMTGKQWEI